MYELEKKFNDIPLKAHDFLNCVPMHSLDFIELKGGRRGMKMDEIYRITRLNQTEEFKPKSITGVLFWLRGLIGKIMGWDDVPELVNKTSWISQLTEEEREKSLIPTGKTESISTIFYCFKNEILFEIINRTVHCFWILASVEKSDGYDLYVAIYVKKLNWRTPIYMTLISPMLKWVIYPAMKRSIQENWNKEFSNTISMNKTVRV
jgi:Protein of unknown function (DUF2867)